MNEYWNPTTLLPDQENIDAITKWVLLITGFLGVIISILAYVYPAGNPDPLILFLLSISLISKGQGRGRFIQMPWKTYFWACVTVFVLMPIYGFIRIEDMHETVSMANYEILIFTWIGIIAVYGFVYQKALFSQKFWKAGFLIYMGIVSIDYVTEIISAESFSPIGIGWSYLSLLSVLPFYYALGMYAFNRDAVIQKSPCRTWEFISIGSFKSYNRNGVLTLVYAFISLLLMYLSKVVSDPFWYGFGLIIFGVLSFRYMWKYTRDLFNPN